MVIVCNEQEHVYIPATLQPTPQMRRHTADLRWQTQKYTKP